MDIFKVVTLVTSLILLGLLIYCFLDKTRIETGYFPETPEFPTRHTPYRQQELTSVDEIMNNTRIPYYPRCNFPKTELPLP